MINLLGILWKDVLLSWLLTSFLVYFPKFFSVSKYIKDLHSLTVSFLKSHFLCWGHKVICYIFFQKSDLPFIYSYGESKHPIVFCEWTVCFLELLLNNLSFPHTCSVMNTNILFYHFFPQQVFGKYPFTRLMKVLSTGAWLRGSRGKTDGC